jgi:hypothetical protein
MSGLRWRAVVAAAIGTFAASAMAQETGGGVGQDTLSAAQALLWTGRLDEAERTFGRVLEREPRAVDALLGIAQARRWGGRPLAAREAALRAVALAGDRADAREELAWTYVDAGRSASARAALGTSATPSPALRARLDELGSVAVKVTTVAYEDEREDEAGRLVRVSRLASRLALAIPLGDATATIVAGGTRVAASAAELDRGLVGGALSVPLGRAELSGGWAVHAGQEEHPLHEGHVAARVALSDAARFAISARRRPLVEIESLAIDEGAYHSAGPGGALDLALAGRRGVDELRLSVQGAPVRATYLYADGRAFEISDANRGWSAAVGAGVNVVAVLGFRAPVDLVLRWDAYLTGFAEPSAAYFSPSFLDGHSPGAEVRVRAWKALELFAEGGFTTALFSEAQESNDPEVKEEEGARREPGGWFGGGGAIVRSGRLTVSARGEVRNDPWYKSRRVFVSLGGAL